MLPAATGGRRRMPGTYLQVQRTLRRSTTGWFSIATCSVKCCHHVVMLHIRCCRKCGQDWTRGSAYGHIQQALHQFHAGRCVDEALGPRSRCKNDRERQRRQLRRRLCRRYAIRCKPALSASFIGGSAAQRCFLRHITMHSARTSAATQYVDPQKLRSALITASIDSPHHC